METPTSYYSVQRKFTHDEEYKNFVVSTDNMKFYLEMLKVWVKCRREGFADLKTAKRYLRHIQKQTLNNTINFRIIRITYIPEISEVVQ